MIKRVIRRFKRWKYKKRLNNVLKQPLEDIYDFVTDDVRYNKVKKPDWNKGVPHEFHLEPISISKDENGKLVASSPLKPTKKPKMVLKLERLFNKE